MRKWMITLPLFALLVAGCSKDDPAPEPAPALPQTPALSPSSVTVEEAQTVDITVSGGKPPYTVNVAPAGVAEAVMRGAVLAVTGLAPGHAVATVKGSDNGAATLPIAVTAKPDPLAAFKADATPRWELPQGEVVRSDTTAFVFLADAGRLFTSAQHKWGYASLDGEQFRLIEWGLEPLLRTEAGAFEITGFRVVQETAATVWLTFSLSDAEHRVVAEKLE